MSNSTILLTHACQTGKSADFTPTVIYTTVSVTQDLLPGMPLVRVWKSILSLLLILLKEVGGARLRESDLHLISPETPAPQYQPIDRKKRKGKIVEDYSRDRADEANKK